MKKVIVVVLFIMIMATFSIPFSATEPTYVYECAKLYYPVTVDGKVDGAEWDDTTSLVVNSDNSVFKEYGRWQGGASPKSAADLSVTYKMKWDDTNLYILEQRKDNNFVKAGDSTAGTTPWNGDGTLFFLAFDASGDYKWDDAYEPFWAMAEDGKMSFALRSWLSGSFQSLQEDMGNWKTAGVYDDSTKTLTVELAIPFADIGTTSGSKSVSVGTSMRWTPIISNLDSKDDYAAFANSWDQLNFHDRFGRDDADTSEAENTAEVPANWAGMILTDVIVVEETVAEAAPEAPAAESAAPAATVAPVAAPQTMDMFTISLAAIALSGAVGTMLAKKRK